MSETRSQLALKITLASFCAMTALIIVLLPLDSPPRDEHLVIGFLLGSLFGHAILAAAWLALGPGPWFVRLPLAVVWSAMLPLALVLNIIIQKQSIGMEAVYLSQIATVILVLVISGCVRFATGRKIQRQPPLQVSSDDSLAESMVSNGGQYGIQHLMILTTVIAVAIAAGRVLLAWLLPLLSGGEMAIFAFLVVAACLTCVPVLFAILGMRRLAAPLVILAIFIAAVTVAEIPLLKAFRGGGPDWLHILLINIFTLFPVLFFTLALRYTGYQFSKRLSASDSVGGRAELLSQQAIPGG